MRAEEIKKEKFGAIAEYLGVRGNVVATEEALFVHDKQRALAYALPGSRFAGLLFFTDQSQGIAAQDKSVPGTEEIETWASEFLKRFQLGPADSKDDRIKVSFSVRALRTESAVEEGKEIKRVPVKTDVLADIRLNGNYVTGPRAKLRLVFKNGRRPALLHRALWERLEFFENRPMVTEDEAYRRISDQLSRRGESYRNWRLIGSRMAYFAGEFAGGPDLLLPYYFAEVEFRDPQDKERTRQGPRQLIQVPAC
jgi:hypothetical protein